MYIDHYGPMVIKNHMTGEYCEIEFKKRGWSGKGAQEVEGYAYNAMKEKKYKIKGKWTESVSVINLENKEEELLWECNPNPPNCESMYNFTFFTLQLNHLPSSLLPHLPPTDTRIRPDQRALEQGNLRLAADEKLRLEDEQRKTRKEREARGEQYEAKYFQEFVDPVTGEVGYKYVRDYWEDRKKREWGHLDKLF